MEKKLIEFKIIGYKEKWQIVTSSRKPHEINQQIRKYLNMFELPQKIMHITYNIENEKVYYEYRPKKQ